MSKFLVLTLLVGCSDATTAPVSAWRPAPAPPVAGWVDEPDADTGADLEGSDVPADLPDAMSDADTGDADVPDLPADPCRDSPEEPNDDADTAHVVAGPRALDGRVCADDVDWFAVTVPGGTSVSARVEFQHDDGDLDLRIWRDGALIATSESEADVEQFSAPLDADDAQYLLEVYGFRGATGAYRLVVASQGAPDFTGRADGAVRYEDRVFGPGGFTGQVREVPGRGLVVQVVRRDDAAIVGQGTSGPDGRFSVDFPGHDAATYHLRVLAAVDVEGLRGAVQDRSPAHLTYALDSDVWRGDAPQLELVARADSAIGGAFNIADALGIGMRFVRAYSSADAPLVSVRWERGAAFDCGSCYGGDRISLGGAPEDPDQYDDDIILHELAHWVMDRFSADNNPGGQHRDLQVPPVLAYGEGVAYFLSALWRDDPGITDNFADGARFIDLEAVTQNMEDRDALFGTDDGTIFGDMREEIPGAILWDAYDEFRDEEPFDTVSIGVDGHAEILFEIFGNGDTPDVGPRGIDLSDWLSVASCWRPEIGAALVGVAHDRGYPFDPDAHVECANKGGGPARIVVEGPDVVVVPREALGKVQVDVRTDGRWSTAPCDYLPCPVGSAGADEVVVVVAWAGGVERASWLSAPRRLALRGGQVSYGVRAYRDSGMVAR